MKRWLSPLVLIVLMTSSTPAEEAQDPAPAIASSQEARAALTTFAREYKTLDTGLQSEALDRLSRCVHPDVARRLLQVVHRSRETEVRVAAMDGLARQVPSARSIEPHLKGLLDEEEKAPPDLLAAVMRTARILDCRKLWRDIADRLVHPKDVVVVAGVEALGAWKELRAHEILYRLWFMYPAENKWVGGDRTVGILGAWITEFERKYGKGEMRRPRPEVTRALRAAVANLTGEELATHDDFYRWCQEHAKDIEAAKRRRD